MLGCSRTWSLTMGLSLVLELCRSHSYWGTHGELLSLFSQTHPLPIRAQEKSLPHLESGNNLSVKKLGD